MGNPAKGQDSGGCAQAAPRVWDVGVTFKVFAASAAEAEALLVERIDDLGFGWFGCSVSEGER